MMQRPLQADTCDVNSSLVHTNHYLRLANSQIVPLLQHSHRSIDYSNGRIRINPAIACNRGQD